MLRVSHTLLSFCSFSQTHLSHHGAQQVDGSRVLALGRHGCGHGGDAGAPGAHCSPSLLLMCPPSIKWINKHSPTLCPAGLLVMHACRHQIEKKSLNKNHVLVASKRHENILCAQLLSQPNLGKKSPRPFPGAVRGNPTAAVFLFQHPRPAEGVFNPGRAGS